MSRVKIQFPQESIFSVEIPIRIGDINYGGHLGNDALLGILHEARVAFLKANNYTELDLEGTSLIMGDVQIVFLAEGFQGDILKVEVALQDPSNSGFDMYYKVTNVEGAQQLAIAKTGMICFNYEKRKVQALPQEFRNKFFAE